MFERTGKHKKKQKNIFFNYFLIYRVVRENVQNFIIVSKI
jgi:hypothetical protein